MSKRLGRTRSTMGAKLCAALKAGALALPRCRQCGATHYPPTSICRHCLSSDIELSAVDPHGTVIASALVHRSYAADFASGGPWPIASVKLDVGPIVFCHTASLLTSGTAVALVPVVDRLGDGVLAALRTDDERALIAARFTEKT